VFCKVARQQGAALGAGMYAFKAYDHDTVELMDCLKSAGYKESCVSDVLGTESIAAVFK